MYAFWLLVFYCFFKCKILCLAATWNWSLLWPTCNGILVAPHWCHIGHKRTLLLSVPPPWQDSVALSCLLILPKGCSDVLLLTICVWHLCVPFGCQWCQRYEMDSSLYQFQILHAINLLNFSPWNAKLVTLLLLRSCTSVMLSLALTLLLNLVASLSIVWPCELSGMTSQTQPNIRVFFICFRLASFSHEIWLHFTIKV